jgi:hypothetical protein
VVITSVERHWATEYTFVNPRGERVTRADRLANLRAGRTAFDSIAHAPQEEEILTYGGGEVAVYTTLLTLGGRYGGEGERGEFRALVVWIRRDGPRSSGHKARIRKSQPARCSLSKRASCASFPG